MDFCPLSHEVNPLLCYMYIFCRNNSSLIPTRSTIPRMLYLKVPAMEQYCSTGTGPMFHIVSVEASNSSMCTAQYVGTAVCTNTALQLLRAILLPPRIETTAGVALSARLVDARRYLSYRPNTRRKETSIANYTIGHYFPRAFVPPTFQH